MARQVEVALAFFHSVGVAHFDLPSTENVVRQADGVLRLSDYGAAAILCGRPHDVAWVEETGGTTSSVAGSGIHHSV